MLYFDFNHLDSSLFESFNGLKFEVKLLARDRKPIEAALWRLQSTLKELVGAEAQDLLRGMEESIG